MTYLAYIVLPILLVALPILLARHIDRTSTRGPFDEHRPLVFRVSGWMFGVLLLVVLAFGAFMIAAFLYAKEGKVFLVLLGTFFVLLGLFELWRLSKAKVTISEESIVYIKGRKETVVPLASIRSVVVANGLIIIDTGTIPRPVLPLYFRNATQMISVLRQGANSRAET